MNSRRLRQLPQRDTRKEFIGSLSHLAAFWPDNGIAMTKVTNPTPTSMGLRGAVAKAESTLPQVIVTIVLAGGNFRRFSILQQTRPRETTHTVMSSWTATLSPRGSPGTQTNNFSSALRKSGHASSQLHAPIEQLTYESAGRVQARDRPNRHGRAAIRGSTKCSPLHVVGFDNVRCLER